MNVSQFLEQARDCPILVIGDLMLDEYLWGHVERISPEAPVQVVDVADEEIRLGGAGNVIRNLVELGCRVSAAGVVGKDDDGELLGKMLETAGVDCRALQVVADRRTGRKTRVLSNSQQMLRIDRESREEISPDVEAGLLETVLPLIPRQRVVLVSDYGKGVLTERVLRDVLAAGRAAGVPVLVDPKGADFLRYRGAFLLTPNRREAGLAAGIPVEDEASAHAAGRALMAQCSLQALVLTRSEEGMSVFLEDGSVTPMPTRARDVYDVSGAGDTVLVFVGLGVATGLSVIEAAALANAAAGIVVGKVGTSTVSAADLLTAAGDDSGLNRKIRPAAELAAILADRRRQGQTIVFTNGCFDLLHVGHVRYLQQARKLGDLLVLGLNSDASIRRLKGPKRPLIGADERAHLLAALDCVDFVVMFDEDTPLALIESLRPDILVKGSDYTPEEVVGREFVESQGGRVELIRVVDGKSTSNLIEKILQAYQS